MKKIKVRFKAKSHIYIHNDISNATYYFQKRINERIKNDDREGVGIEIMAGLILLAFEVEARFNFLGFKLVSDWKERQPHKHKIKQICDIVGIKPNHDERPYKSLTILQEFRDSLAHGKPEEKEIDEEIITTHEELDKMWLLTPKWQANNTQEFLNLAYEDMELIWKELLEKSGLRLWDAMTRGDHQISFIGEINE